MNSPYKIYVSDAKPQENTPTHEMYTYFLWRTLTEIFIEISNKNTAAPIVWLSAKFAALQEKQEYFDVLNQVCHTCSFQFKSSFELYIPRT